MNEIESGENMEITISDLIQVVAICISLLVAVISIIQSNKSIRLSEKSIEDANRPYLSFYVETIDTIYFSKDLVLKNFGNTSAKILELTFLTPLDETNEERQLNSLINGTVAPQQKFTTNLDSDFNELISIHIKYQDLSNNIYEESFDVKTDMGNDLLWSAQSFSKDSPEATAIKQSTHAIIKAFK